MNLSPSNSAPYLASLCTLALASQASAALYINEIFFNPDGADGPSEYVEIRGAANAVIPAGTYLVNIEGDQTAALPAGAGDVQTIFDLSGLTLGSNGYLVLLQEASPHASNPLANTLTASDGSPGLDGFEGFSFFSADSGSVDLENPSNNFLLISAPTAPLLTDDVDATAGGLSGDGVLDGVATSWTILDGVSVLDGNNNDVAYADIVFSQNSLGQILQPGSILVNTGGLTSDYVGRIGDSTGSGAGDWVAGDTVETSPGVFTLDPFATFPGALAGAPLDHIGSTNPVPEPTTLALIAVPLLLRRRRA